MIKRLIVEALTGIVTFPYIPCICSHKIKMDVKLKTEYGAVLHMPVLKEGKDRVSHPGSLQQSYSQPGEDETNTACTSFSVKTVFPFNVA